MAQLALTTLLVAATAKLRIMDPVEGPTERAADAVVPSDELLVFVGGRPCYRPVVMAAPAAPPEKCVLVRSESVATQVPSKDMLVGASQHLAIAFPVGAPLAPAVELPSVKSRKPGGSWVELTLQDAEAVVVEGLKFATAKAASESVKAAQAGEASGVPLKAHAGARELPAHSPQHDGILSTWCFTVPPRTTTIRLSSMSAQPPGDPRHLGVAIYQLTMDGVAIPLDSPALVRGFHRMESSDELTWRWTDGEALLILPPKSFEQIVSVGVTNWHETLVS